MTSCNGEDELIDQYRARRRRRSVKVEATSPGSGGSRSSLRVTESTERDYEAGQDVVIAESSLKTSLIADPGA